MTQEDKKNAITYILLKLSEWYKENKSIEENDLSILKSLKLFFLLSTVNTDKDNENLIDIGFDKYVAMPFGPVESDVYDFFKEQNYIDKTSLDYNNLLSEDISELNKDIKKVIDDCLNELQSINNNIINLSASLLVDLTHKYSSWIVSYNNAKANNVLTWRMSNNAIKSEEKFYFI